VVRWEGFDPDEYELRKRRDASGPTAGARRPHPRVGSDLRFSNSEKHFLWDQKIEGLTPCIVRETTRVTLADELRRSRASKPETRKRCD